MSDAPEAPPTDRPSSVTSSPLWPVTLALAFVCGGLIGGIVVYAGGWGVGGRDATARSTTGGAIPADHAPYPQIVLDDDAPPGSAAAREVSAATTPDSRIAPGETDDMDDDPAAEPRPPDTSPAGLRKTYGDAVVLFRGEDAEGDPRTPAPAVAVGPTRVLTPFSAVEGTTYARVTGTSAGEFEVVGIVAFDPAFDIAMLEVDAPLPGPFLVIDAAPLARTTPAVLLGAAREKTWEPTAVTLRPGASARLGGGPRLAFETPATFPGAAIDEEGRLLGLVPAAAEPARPAHVAGSWPSLASTPVALDAFLRTAGPGAPSSQVQTAQKLLAQRRYDEAARLYLLLTAAEPKLLPAVWDDLRTAALEAARAHLTAGQGPTAVVLLTEVLARRPDDATIWAARARAHAVAGDAGQAIDAFLRAIELDPSHEATWRSEARGVLTDEVNRLHGRGLVDAALSLLLEQRRSFPGDGRLRIMAAGLLLEDGRFAVAATLYDEASALDARVASEAREGARRARDLAGGPGAIAIDFTPGTSDIVVEVRIDDRVTTRLVIDPSRDLSAVSSAVARGARYSLAAAPRVRWEFDPAVPEVHVIELRSVVVAGVGTDRVRAAVADTPVSGAEGVLGATFLARYRVVQDRELGRMVLWPR